MLVVFTAFVPQQVTALPPRPSGTPPKIGGEGFVFLYLNSPPFFQGGVPVGRGGFKTDLFKVFFYFG